MHPVITKSLINKHKEKTKDIFDYGNFSFVITNPDHNLKSFMFYMYYKLKDKGLDSCIIEQKNNNVTYTYFTGPIMSIETVSFKEDIMTVDCVLTNIHEKYGFR